MINEITGQLTSETVQLHNTLAWKLIHNKLPFCTFPFYRDYVILGKIKRTAVVKEGKDLRCIKRDATESKISKKLDYFLNKMPDCLPQNKFLSKNKQINEKQFRNSKSRLNFDTRGIKIKKTNFFEILVNIWVSTTLKF